MSHSARRYVAAFVRDCDLTFRGRRRSAHCDPRGLDQFAGYLETLPDHDVRPDALLAIAGGHRPYQPAPAVREAILRSTRRGANADAVLDGLVAFASAEALATLRERYRRGEVTP